MSSKDPLDIDMESEALPNIVVDNTMALTLPNGKIASLVNALNSEISRASAMETSAILHFTSANENEGAGHISIETAYFMAISENKRVLFVDTDPQAQKDGIVLRKGLFIERQSKNSPTIITLDKVGFSYTNFSIKDTNGNLCIKLADIKTLFSIFKKSYDLVVIHSHGALNDGMASILASVCDGTVIVIKAEATRSPVVEELKNVIIEQGGVIFGAIMSGRKHYIPQWLYKFLFNSKTLSIEM